MGHASQGCSNEGVGRDASIYSNLEESWSRVSHAARKLATAMVKMFPSPTNGRYLGTSLLLV